MYKTRLLNKVGRFVFLNLFIQNDFYAKDPVRETFAGMFLFSLECGV